MKPKSTCKAKSKDIQTFEVEIPKTVFYANDQQKNIKVPMPEMNLSNGPSSSIIGRLYQVQYVL